MSGSRLEVPSNWQVLGATVPGSSHLRSGIPNQDSFAHNSENREANAPLLLAVSDGHGSASCFRSDVGSRFAVDTFMAELQTFLTGDFGGDLTLLKRTAEERLPEQLVRSWEQKVRAHLAANPVLQTEWDTLSQKEGPKRVSRLQDNPLLIYGATLLGVVITPQFMLYLQLGDGEILDVDSSGLATPALEKDERLFANETTSLCRPNAWRDFRFRFQVLTDTPPAMLLLTTDGYANSFKDTTGFLQVGKDLWQMLAEDGPAFIGQQLPEWLTDATHQGSGDDCTLLLAWKPELLPSPNQSTAPTDLQPVTETNQLPPTSPEQPTGEPHE